MLFLVKNINAQNPKVQLAIGPEFLQPTYSGISSSGIGGGVEAGYFLNKKFEININLSYHHFNGDVIDFYKKDTIHGFSIIPVLPGLKYFITKRLYANAAAGIVVGAKNAGNHFALSPSVGLLLPVSSKSAIDIGIKLIGVPLGYSFSENIFLNKGGYSYLGFRVAYVVR